MKILIVGTDLNSVLLAKYIYLQNQKHDIYIISGETEKSDFFTSINIKENDINSIIDFVKYNGIEFTVVLSQLAIINGIANAFKDEGFPVFSPFSEAARITFFNGIAKKIMYKLKIPTPKFGIFDRENIAIDYIRNSKFPIVAENDFTLTERISDKYNCFSKAREGIIRLFENGTEKIVIENYIEEEPLYLYFITDGYNAFPLISVERVSGDGYTSAIAPSQKIDTDMTLNILKRAVYPIIDDIAKFADGYCGILGMKLKIKNGNFYISEFYNGFQFYDFQAFLSLLNENLADLLYSCANGSLADDYNFVDLKDEFSYTFAIDKNKILNPENINSDCEFYESEDAVKKIYTATAVTINRAKTKIFDSLENNIDEKFLKDIVSKDKKKDLVR